MRITLCDDDPAQTALLEAHCRQWARQRGVSLSTACYHSAEAFLFAWEGDKTADALLLDIEMPGVNGMELARRLRQEQEDLPIVFVTGYPDYMAEGYEVSALQYLLKPIQQEKLFACLDRALRAAKTSPPLLVPCGEEVVRLRQEEILFLEAFAHTVQVVATGGTWTTAGGIGRWETQLDADSFVRPHRSYLVGLRHVRRIGRDDLTLDDGRTIPLSRRRWEAVNRAFIRYHGGSER